MDTNAFGTHTVGPIVSDGCVPTQTITLNINLEKLRDFKKSYGVDTLEMILGRVVLELLDD
jgi:hypothetical protein